MTEALHCLHPHLTTHSLDRSLPLRYPQWNPHPNFPRSNPHPLQIQRLTDRTMNQTYYFPRRYCSLQVLIYMSFLNSEKQISRDHESQE